MRSASIDDQKQKAVVTADSNDNSAETFPPHDHPLSTTPPQGNVLSFLPHAVFMAHVATQLDERTLSALTCVSRQARDWMNQDVPLWQRLLQNLGVEPEAGKTGADYKALCRLFTRILPEQAFFADELKLKADITLPETAVLHQAIIDARDSLQNFLEDPQRFFRVFYEFVRALYGLDADHKLGDRVHEVIEQISNRYGKIQLVSDVEAKESIVKFLPAFADLTMELQRQGFSDMYSAVSYNFSKHLPVFLKLFAEGDFPREPRDVDQSDPTWRQAFLAVHEGVKAVDPEAAAQIEQLLGDIRREGDENSDSDFGFDPDAADDRETVSP